MKRIWIVAVPVSVVALVLAVSASAGDRGSRHRDHGSVFTVVEHATTDATTDTGAAGDSAGDLLTFANEMFDARDTRVVGTNQGSCVRIVPGESYECSWTNFLPRGQIVVSGPFFDAKGSTLAITGGTGDYRNARGTMRLSSREGGTKFAFEFHVSR